MKVSAQAAETASTNGHGKPDSPSLAQLKAAIEPDALTGGDGDQAASDTATAVLEEGEEEELNIGDDGYGGGETAAVPCECNAGCGNIVKAIPGTGCTCCCGELQAIEQVGDQELADEEEREPITIVQGADGVFTSLAEAEQKESREMNEFAAAHFARVDTDIAAPTTRPTPAPYDPIAEVEEEIAENNERIVAHAIRASELDTMLKATKKSLKTAADEGVELAVRRAGLLLQQKEKAERDAAGRGNATGVSQLREGNPDAGFASAKDHPVPIANGSYSVPDDAGSIPAPASLSDPESTEAHATRMAEAFAPSPAADLPPTPEQERYDHEFRSLAIEGLEGLTPKILEILHANDVYTVGAFQDWPKKTGCEYTQMSGGNAKLTEVRYEKIMDAMMAYMKANPRPEGEPMPAPVTDEQFNTALANLDIDDI